MANAMDTVLQQASQAIDTSGIGKGTAEGLSAGMSLAQRQAQIEQQRQQLDFQRQQHEIQKHDWFNSNLMDAMNESDPKVRKLMIGELSDTSLQIFGKRIKPEFLEAAEKSPNFQDKLRSLINIRQAIATGKPESLPAWDQHALDFMTNKGLSDFIKMANPIVQNEATIYKAMSQTAAGGINPIALKQAAQNGDSNAIQNEIANNPKYANRRAMLAMRADDQASKAGGAFEKDTVLNQYYKQRTGVQRAIHTIDGGGVISPQMKAEIEQEISTALSGQGVAGEGKLSRTEFNTSATKAAEWLQKFGNKPVDLKKAAPEVIGYLQDTLKRLDDAYGGSIEDRASKVASSFSQSSNDKVKTVIGAKFQQYTGKPLGQPQMAVSGDASAGSGQSPALQNPAKPGATNPKMMADQRAQLKQQAMAKIQQIKGAPAGTMTMTEQDVRDKYKALTGEDLQ